MDDLLEAEQHAGDVLYLPSMWAHSVLNVRDSMAKAMEFSDCGPRVDGDELRALETFGEVPRGAGLADQTTAMHGLVAAGHDDDDEASEFE